MDKWKILGIEKTEDLDAIKQAYRKKLVQVNPEDDPEGFMLLRQAFEEANYEAERKDEVEEEQDKDELTQQLLGIYEDFSKRIDVDVWKGFFGQDVFVSLESAEEARDRVLVFIMDHSFLPHKVMKLLVDSFNLVEQREELEERFPQNFIDFIIRNATYKDSLNYEMFLEVSDDIDLFIHKYYQLDSLLQGGTEEQQRQILEELQGMQCVHPYVKRCEILIDVQMICKKQPDREKRAVEFQVELEELQAKADALLADYDTDHTLLVLAGDIAMLRRDSKKGRAIFERAHELFPDSYRVKGQLAELAILDGEYEKARDMFMEMLDINRFDEGARQGMMRANTGLIQQYKEQIEASPLDGEVKIKLLWCYYRNGMFEESEEFLHSFEPSEDIKADYYNLLGRTYFYINRYEEALDGFLKWRDALKEQPDWEEPEKRKKKEHGIQYSNYFLGECCISLKRYDEAREYLNIATEKEFEEMVYACEALCRLEYEADNYEACIRACNRLLERDWENYDACIYMAKSFFELDQYSGVIDACDRAIMIYPYITEPYVLKLKVYWNVDQYDDMRDVISRYERFDIVSDEILYYKARLCQIEDETEKSNTYLQMILDRKDSGEKTDMEDYRKVYLEYASNCHVLGLFDKELEFYDTIMQMTEQSWLMRRCYVGRAAALCCMKRFEEAKEVYELCETEFGYEQRYVIDHGELLVRMGNMQGCAELMMHAIETVKDNDSFLQTLLGNLCCFYGNEGYLDEAYSIFQMGIEKIPGDYLMYRSLGYIYLEHERYQEAKELLLKSIELDVDRECYTHGLLILAISHLDDINKPEYKEYIDVAHEQFADVNSAYGYIKKAEFYRGLGRYEEALQLVKLALAEPRGYMSCFLEDDGAWYEMGNIYAEMKDVEQALRCYRKSNEIYGHSGLAMGAIERLSVGR